RPDPLRFLLIEATLGDAQGDVFLVLELPRNSVLAPEVELVVERVEADRRTAVRLLEVDVPAPEPPLLSLPEEPDRVAVAWPSQHQRSVPFPMLAVYPWMLTAWPVSLGEPDRGPLRQVSHEQARLVGDDDDRNRQPRLLRPDLAEDNRLAGSPGH